jgi:hypothetical protein
MEGARSERLLSMLHQKTRCIRRHAASEERTFAMRKMQMGLWFLFVGALAPLAQAQGPNDPFGVDMELIGNCFLPNLLPAARYSGQRQRRLGANLRTLGVGGIEPTHGHSARRREWSDEWPTFI